MFQRLNMDLSLGMGSPQQSIHVRRNYKRNTIHNILAGQMSLGDAAKLVKSSSKLKYYNSFNIQF